MTTTELIENPFVVLGLPMTATNEAVVEAYQDQLEADPDRESPLMAARRALLSPKLRLAAEIGWLPGAPDESAARIRAALRSQSPSIADWLALAGGLPPLARSNVLLHAVQTLGPEATAIDVFIDAQAEVDLDAVHAAIAELRAAADAVPASQEAVGSELSKWQQRQLAILFERASDPVALAETLAVVAARILPLKDDRRTEVLDEVLHAYWRRAAADTAQVRARLKETGDALLSNVWSPPDLTSFVEDLHRWRTLAYPLQALEGAKGRDEPESHAVFHDARGVYIALANDRRLPDVATRLAEALRATFSMLPRASAQIDDDLAALKPLVDEQRARALLLALDRIYADLRAQGGASPQLGTDLATPEWHAVWSGLDDAVAALGASLDMPWLEVRGVSLFLCNEAKQPATAQAVTAALATRAAARGAAQHVLDLLTKDANDIAFIVLERTLGDLIEQKKWGKAARTVDELLEKAPDAQTVASYTDLRAQIKIKERGLIGAWAVPIVLGLGVLLLSIFNRHAPPQSSSPPDLSNPFSGTPALSIPVPETSAPPEQKPRPVGDSPDGHAFTRANLRYCLFERARLEHMRGLTATTDNRVTRFNAVVDDFNAHCSRYRYRQSDMTQVQSEVTARAEILRAEARNRVESWGK